MASPTASQTGPQDDEDENEQFWSVVEILAERGNKYKVRWEGDDPRTGKPWPPSWVSKKDCTGGLVQAWKDKKAGKKGQVGKRKTTSTARALTTSPETTKGSTRTISKTYKKASANRRTLPTRDPPLSPSLANSSRTRPKSGSSPHAAVHDGKHYDIDKIVLTTKKRRKRVEVAVPPLPYPVMKERISSLAAMDNGDLEIADRNESPTELFSAVSTLKIGPPRGVKRKRPSSGAAARKSARTSTVVTDFGVEEPMHIDAVDRYESHGLDENDTLYTHNGDQFAPEVQSPSLTPPPSPSSRTRPSAWLDSPPKVTPIPSTPRPPVASVPHTPMKLRVRPRSPQNVEKAIGYVESPIADEDRHTDVILPSVADETEIEGTASQRPIKPLPLYSRSSPTVLRTYRTARKLNELAGFTEQFRSQEEGRQLASTLAIWKEKARNKGKARYVESGEDDGISDFSENGRAHQSAARRRGSVITEDDDVGGDGQFDDAPTLHSPEENAERDITEEADGNDWLFQSSTESIPASVAGGLVPDSQESFYSSEILGIQDAHDPNADALVQELVDTYVDFNGGQGERQQQSPPAEPAELSLGPELPSSKQKAGPLQEAREARRKHWLRKSAPLPRLAPISEELPFTASPQQAGVDSQIPGTSAFRHQPRDLSINLEEKDAQIAQLTEQVAELNLKLETLQEENVDLSTVRKELGLKYFEHERAQLEMNAMRFELHERQILIDDLKRDKASAKDDLSALENGLQEQQGLLTETQKTKEEAEKDRQQLRELYNQASARASDLLKERDELQKQLDLAAGQLKDGLPMLKGVYEDRIKKMQEDLDKWKALCRMLMDKDVRSTDDVRTRAAMEPLLREENENLRQEIAVLKTLYGDGGSASEEPRRNSESEVDNYVCQYTGASGSASGATPCNAVFSSPEEVKKHAIRTHYPDLQNPFYAVS